MPDPTTSTYLGVPGFVMLWVIAVIAFFMFGRRILHLVRVLRLARPETRWDQLPTRIRYVVSNVLGQRRLLNEPAFGLAHFFIFWTFVFYASSFLWNLIRGLFPVLPLAYADEVPWVTFFMEVLSVIALAAIIGAALRRYVFTPERLERTFDASFVLSLIGILLVTFLAGQGFKSVAGEHQVAGSPVGNALAGTFGGGMQPATAAALYQAMWWLHMVTVLFFLAYLPYSKHGHLLFSPFSVFFSSLRPGGMPPVSEGAARLEQFTWRELFNALACAECGRCDRACPAFNSGFPLSPKDVIHALKELVLSVDRAATASGSGGDGADRWTLLGERVSAESAWACTTCMACMELCPVFNEHVPLLTELRRFMVSEGELEERLQEVMTAVTRYGNSFGKSPRARAKWTQGLDFKIKDARKEPVEYLWFVGDYASYDPRLERASHAMARVLMKAGVDFGILYDAEQNTGNDIRRAGEEGLFDLLKEKNLQSLGTAGFSKIVTTDPHSYHALKNEYSNGNGELVGIEVLHYAELVDRLVSSQRLTFDHKLDLKATYHDPCYLGRYNGVYRPPRRVLRQLGLDLVEMPRNRRKAYCCGAGGGRIWMEDVAGIEERPSESRVREAAALDGVQALIVACPKDLVMFQDAVKTTELEGQLVVRDMIELVDEAAGLEQGLGEARS
jgi:Fe-S oxidoreductase